MNGATAEPCESAIKAPSKTKKTMTGVSHHFLRSFKKAQSSLSVDNLDIIQPKVYLFSARPQDER